MRCFCGRIVLECGTRSLRFPCVDWFGTGSKKASVDLTVAGKPIFTAIAAIAAKGEAGFLFAENLKSYLVIVTTGTCVEIGT